MNAKVSESRTGLATLEPKSSFPKLTSFLTFCFQHTLLFIKRGGNVNGVIL